MQRIELLSYLNQLLTPDLYQDYGPNGLQIEGANDIHHICFAVSACRETIEKAVALKADTMIVHHGLFWNFHGVRTITGPFANRVKPLIQNNINLIGYHLPLDAHIEVGNAASLAALIGLQNLAPFGNYKGIATGVKGELAQALPQQTFAQLLEKVTQHKVLHSVSHQSEIKSVGIITGGANSDWLQAARLGLDAYISGEMSEHDWHDAKEHGVHFYACGHHATERFGIQKLMQKLQQDFSNIRCSYIDVQNPA
jgi:dinuclear metal center YbgI/SA1388 family protein